MSLQDQYDEAAFIFSNGDFATAITRFDDILKEDTEHFEARIGLSMSYYRMGDYARAIEEGHRAERMRPIEQRVHTNLSLFYMKAGDKQTAEHHGLQARIASWKMPAADQPKAEPGSALELAKPPPPKPVKLPDMPWKKKAAPPASTPPRHE